MQILYITPFSPDMNSGGGRHCYANLMSLLEYPQLETLHYVGPPFNHKLEGFQSKKFGMVVSRPFNILDKVKAALSVSATSLISLFNEFKRLPVLDNFDLVFIESTRCGFLFNAIDIKTKTICNIHNVEADYICNNHKGLYWLLFMNIKYNEMRSLKKSNLLLIMHHHDLKRLREIYKLTPSLNYFYHPVCSFKPRFPIVPFEQREKVLFYSGSLECRFNEIGIITFIKQCWPNLIETGYKLRIAGRNPSRKLLGFINNYKGIELISNPDDMESLLRKASIFILPDILGTGMKLRIAEALSLGVPIVGTVRGLLGYQDIENFGIAVDNIPNMVTPIKDLLLNHQKLFNLASGAYESWNQKYSFSSFRERLHGILRATKLY